MQPTEEPVATEEKKLEGGLLFQPRTPPPPAITLPIVKFRNAVLVSVLLVLWSNVLIVWTIQQSSSIQSMLFPLCINGVMTGSLFTMLFQRRSLFRLQNFSLETSFRYKDVAHQYQNFMFLCIILLPLLTIICCMTLFHVVLHLTRESAHTVCPNTYTAALNNLNPNGKAIFALYVMTLVAVLISAVLANIFALILSSFYIGEFRVVAHG